VTITPRQLDQKLALRNEFLAVLTAAQQERMDRQDIVDGELEWVRFERETMHRAVNEARGEAGKQPLPIDAVERVESSATGHSDYNSKFALYCAELVLEQP
jgi:phosphopantetheine adenylyltransferase